MKKFQFFVVLVVPFLFVSCWSYNFIPYKPKVSRSERESKKFLIEHMIKKAENYINNEWSFTLAGVKKLSKNSWAFLLKAPNIRKGVFGTRVPRDLVIAIAPTGKAPFIGVRTAPNGKNSWAHVHVPATNCFAVWVDNDSIKIDDVSIDVYGAPSKDFSFNGHTCEISVETLRHDNGFTANVEEAKQVADALCSAFNLDC